jgi:hypothetical protein
MTHLFLINMQQGPRPTKPQLSPVDNDNCFLVFFALHFLWVFCGAWRKRGTIGTEFGNAKKLGR